MLKLVVKDERKLQKRYEAKRRRFRSFRGVGRVRGGREDGEGWGFCLRGGGWRKRREREV